MNDLEQIDMLREMIAEGRATPEDLQRRLAEHREQEQEGQYSQIDRAAEEGRAWSLVNR